jgi:hypothetical protein
MRVVAVIAAFRRERMQTLRRSRQLVTPAGVRAPLHWSAPPAGTRSNVRTMVSVLALGAPSVVALVVLAIVLAGAALAAAFLRRQSPRAGAHSRVPSSAMSDPLEDVRPFVQTYWGDADSREEVQRDLRRMARMHPRGVREGIEAIDALLAAPPEPGALVQLVAWDGNTPLDSGTDAEAVEWLRDFAELARGALADIRAESLSRTPPDRAP